MYDLLLFTFLRLQFFHNLEAASAFYLQANNFLVCSFFPEVWTESTAVISHPSVLWQLGDMSDGVVSG